MMTMLSQEAIDAILAKGRIYEVGGAVRDQLMSRVNSVKDRDYLVTGVSYDDLTSLLRKFGRVDVVGRSFGVIKLTQFRGDDSVTFDISLPRKEHSTGVGHKDFAVNFDPDIPVTEDLIRRDFTINAMALSLDTKELVDPLNGKMDLDSKLIRMTSEQSFSEDPLRMLRAIQFAARFQFEIEPDTLAAITRNASLISSVSAERIADELTKLLTLAEKPSVGFRLMQSSGLLKEILPELDACFGVEQPGGFHAFDVFEHTIRAIDASKPSLRVRLAALFHDIRKPQHKRVVEKGATFYGHEIGGAKAAKAVMQRLRFPNDLGNEVGKLVELHMFTTDVTDKGMRRLIRRTGLELIFDLLDLRRADVAAMGMGHTTEDVDEFEVKIRAEIDRKAPFGLKDLALNGQDLMQKFQLQAGPMIGKVLEHLLEKVLDLPEDNTPEKLEEYARQYLASSPDGTIDSNSNNKGFVQ
jgi:tRNA nucleotidyltransferase (CCA-adding enzyme)